MKDSSNIPVHTIQARDGLQLRIRALVPDDARHLVDLFNHMGSESRYLRFNLNLTSPDPELVWREARRMARIDPQKDGAWLVFADLPDQPDAPIAGARFVRISPEIAEASIAVRDDQQRKGIGIQLLQFLVAEAQAAGVKTLTATVQRTNRPVWKLLRHFSLPVTLESEGNTTIINADLRPEPGA